MTHYPTSEWSAIKPSFTAEEASFIAKEVSLIDEAISLSAQPKSLMAAARIIVAIMIAAEIIIVFIMDVLSDMTHPLPFDARCFFLVFCFRIR
jgi:hypothetical protein